MAIDYTKPEDWMVRHVDGALLGLTNWQRHGYRMTDDQYEKLYSLYDTERTRRQRQEKKDE